MVDLNPGNVDERETQRSERANSRELPRGKVCHTQGWTELCQGKKKPTKNHQKTKNLPSVLLTTNPNPGEGKDPSEGTAPSDSRGAPGD